MLAEGSCKFEYFNREPPGTMGLGLFSWEVKPILRVAPCILIEKAVL